MMAPDEVCELAQNLAKNCGYAVFPCIASYNPETNKRPACPNGLLNATKDHAEITKLWRRYPGQLVGIRTGEPSGIDVLDVDIKHESAVAWWRAGFQRIPATRTFRTQQGGLHLYFQHAAGVRNTQSKLSFGVDTRGDGGYAISWFCAGFECVDQNPAAPWPAWLLEAVLWEKPKPSFVAAKHEKHGDKSVEGIIRTVSAAQEGQRNALLFWGACRFGERIQAGQIGKDEAASLLITAAQIAGLNATEATRTVASAWRAA